MVILETFIDFNVCTYHKERILEICKWTGRTFFFFVDSFLLEVNKKLSRPQFALLIDYNLP